MVWNETTEMIESIGRQKKNQPVKEKVKNEGFNKILSKWLLIIFRC